MSVSRTSRNQDEAGGDVVGTSRTTSVDMDQHAQLGEQSFLIATFRIESGGGRGLRVNASSALKTGDYLVLTQPSEPGHATDRPAHSKAYERWMIIPFVLVPLGFVFALFYWASFYD